MNLFELLVKIGVDDQASKNISNITQKLGNGLKTAAKIGTAAVGVAATGITALTTAAVKNYAEYEQLIGGVETLYGSAYKSVEEYAEGVGISLEEAQATFEQYQNRQQKVLDNAANAYKTAGMSANEYMNTVNGFAASLTNSLGEYEWTAANYADMIVSDMADNANKMGTSMEMIQNAYSGFAKQNYTMLDNLKLGYGGTKTEMERLLRDAEVFAGYTEGSLNIESFADVADAIHIIQEEMGITGTTALEAGRTISGSVGAMKAAWTNLVTGIADDNANFSTLVDNFVTTLVGDGSENNLGVIGNLLPRIEVAINGVGDLVEGLAPVIVEKLPSLVSTVLPKLLSAATSVVESVASVFPDLVDTVAEILTSDDTVKSFLGIITSIINAILDAVPDIVDAVLEVLPTVIEELGNSIGKILPKLIEMFVKIVQSLANNIGTIIQSLVKAIPTIIESLNTALKDNFPALLQGVITLVLEIIRNLPAIVKMLTDQIEPIVSTIVSVIVSNLPAFIAGIVQIVFEIVKALPQILASIGSSIFEIFQGIGAGLADAAPSFLDGLGSVWSSLTDWLSEAWGALTSWFSDLWEDFVSIGEDIVDGIWEGLSGAWSGLTEWFSSAWDGLVGGVKSFLGIASPSKLFKNDIAKNVILGIRDGFRDYSDLAVSAMEDVSDDIYNAFDGDYDMEYAVGTSTEPYNGIDVESAFANALNALVSIEEEKSIDVNISVNANSGEFSRVLLNALNVTAKEVYA